MKCYYHFPLALLLEGPFMQKLMHRGRQHHVPQLRLFEFEAVVGHKGRNLYRQVLLVEGKVLLVEN